MNTRRLLLVLTIITFLNANLSGQTNSDYYHIEAVNIPEDISLEVGGLAFDDKGNLGVTTRRGELWLIQNPASKNPVFKRFAHGMHEPLGLNYRDGAFYCSQRGELTKLIDKNGDNIADVYQTIYAWDLNGNYHEYSYGPLFTKEGNMLVALNLGWIGRGASESKWRGWILEITEDGKMTPVATGMRSPAGFGFNKNGDLFYTENQGDWVGSGRMTHVESGDFVGNPAGLRWTNESESNLKLTVSDIDDSKGLTLYEYSKEIPAIKPPSVWFPHTLMGISTSAVAIFPKEFGPFEGQLLIGDQGHSKVMRVFQEKINGVYQGICFPFVEGFSSGVLRFEWAPNNEILYVGMTSRGWRSTGPEMFGLEKLKWSGKTPFEMKTVEIQPDGFKITFTQPINKSVGVSPGDIKVTDFTYKYHQKYGSPVTNKESRVVDKVEVADDGMSLEFTIDRFRPGYIYEIRVPKIKSAKGVGLVHQFGYYTVNEIPGGGEALTASANTEGEIKEATEAALKRITEMPSSWANGPDVTLSIGTKMGLKFDKSFLSVKAGQKVKLEFNNPDDMLHNFVLVNPDKADEVGTAAMGLGLDGQELAYIPDSEDVLFHTGLLQPESSETIYFVAPSKPGNYQYVCTFPGHHLVMRGVLQVK